MRPLEGAGGVRAGVQGGSARDAATVKAGETKLADVAARLGIDPGALRQANPGLKNPDNLKPGQEIHLPQVRTGGPGGGAVHATSSGAAAVSAAPDHARAADQKLTGAVVRASLKPAAPAGGVSAFTGMRLGTNHYGEEVRVKREVGDPRGVDDRLQAVAVARLAGAEPAAVVQGSDGKWHALEVTANFSGGNFRAADTPTRAVQGLPSSTAIQAFRDKIAAVDKELQGPPEPVGDKRDDLLAERAHFRKALAAAIFGVPESEIEFTRSERDRKAGKINIAAYLADPHNPNAPAGVHGAEGGSKDTFQPGVPSAIEINPKELENPERAQGTLFHEASHLKDYELAQKWMAKYDPKSGQSFEKWIDAQPASKLSKADAELVKDVVANRAGTTEARAYAHAFLAALRAGNPGVAAGQLRAYANYLNKGGPQPPGDSHVRAALIKELETAYRSMPQDMRRQFNDAVAASLSVNRGSWLADIRR